MCGLAVPCLIIFLTLSPIADSQSQRGRWSFDPRTYDPKTVKSCDLGSCEPQTGNLLVGREDKLYASSTCGIRKKEKFCQVTHLEKNSKKNCFLCDAHDKAWSHNVSNIVDIAPVPYPTAKYAYMPDPWWQSENGVENVYIQLDMDVEFHFTHLIINFRTFRPAAMLIERSQDFGKTWQVYKYFAYDCSKYFPGRPTEPNGRLNDVVCESKYSHVQPSHGGELIFKVLPPAIHIDDPYSSQVQELVKMTNLRINFTKLHTLGDNLLDRREEIQEKYYYAINHMIVRGSCSCYGHASGCVAATDGTFPETMVHGQCECTHNTKGPNCKECQDLYNDLPWKAGFGKSQNACKQCNCNNHSNLCEFNETIYNLSGKVSGGVCVNCQDNTHGRNCEECIPFYYQEPSYSIQDPYACQQCNCDTKGTTDDGVCDSRTDMALGLQAGQCHCKSNVAGRRCDRCKEGFWNFDEANPVGCEACRCNIEGTQGNLGCDVVTGECTCKRFVIGRDCNQCLPQFWGLSEILDGCKPCDCDPGGSYDNDCDVLSGQCRCRSHMTGRTCDQPEPSYFTGFPDFLVYEAELANGSPDVKIQIIEPNRDGRESLWTGTGYMRTYENSQLEFFIDNIQSPLDYNIVIRYAPQLPKGWGVANIRVVHLDTVEADSPCANSPIGMNTDTELPGHSRSIAIQPSVCLEPGKRYKVILTFAKYDPNAEVVSASVLIDSIVLFPTIEALPILLPEDKNEFDRYRCGEAFLQPDHGELPVVCLKYLKSIGSYVNSGAYKCECNATGSTSFECSQQGGQCGCKPNVVGRQCDTCAPGTYDFGPEGCKSCDCDSLALDNICDPLSGQCKCRNNTYGLKCDECMIGFWNFPNCQRCECNGHAQTCDSKMGVCIDCLNFTVGKHCESCLEGFYGSPRLGYDIPCRACPCPGTIDSGHSYALRCNLDPYTQDVSCECEVGYTGPRCDVCADNYYGNPEERGGSCQPCDCNNNIDVTHPGNCHPKTGKCLQCLYNTEGDHCEVCKERFFGDAINQQCAECVCELLGSNQTAEYCNRTSGQCPCLPNVVGLQCDTCLENHWKIATGEGCEPCDCDTVGSHSKQCNAYDGQCHCRDGFGGRQCNDCMANHWGDPKVECHKCNCDLTGSIRTQCNRNNGTCVCREGIGGGECDRCDRGYLGSAPYCSFCGECFKNWDDTLNNLRGETESLLTVAATIKEVGVWGAYTSEFSEMEASIADVKKLLNSTDVSVEAKHDLEAKISALQAAANESSDRATETISKLEDTDRNVKRADLKLAELRTQMNTLLKAAEDLKENATRLQEANVEGALNLTRKAKADSKEAEEAAVRASENHLANAERNCNRAMTMYNRSSTTIGPTIENNQRTLTDLQQRLNTAQSLIPELNEQVCGKREVCDAACGGALCGTCGGISCETGAVTKANNSLELVNKAEKTIKEKESKAEELLRSVTQAKADAVAARDLTQTAFEKAEAARHSSEDAMNKSIEFSSKLDRFQATAGAKPSEIRALADETRKLNINLEPDQVRGLALKIANAVSELKNIDNILGETNATKEHAKAIRDAANAAKANAEDMLNVVQSVGVALEEAGSAQTRADAAIRQASSDIAAAEKHLTQISSESSEAQAKANETLDSVKGLNDRLQGLNREFTKNKLGAEDIKREVDSISDDANRTLEAVAKLKEAYSEAERGLAERAGRSQTAKDRARHLSERASQFFVTTSNKQKVLEDLEKSYIEKNDTLVGLEEKMRKLSKEMEDYVKNISNKSKYYSECIA